MRDSDRRDVRDAGDQRRQSEQAYLVVNICEIASQSGQIAMEAVKRQQEEERAKMEGKLKEMSDSMEKKWKREHEDLVYQMQRRQQQQVLLAQPWQQMAPKTPDSSEKPSGIEEAAKILHKCSESKVRA